MHSQEEGTHATAEGDLSNRCGCRGERPWTAEHVRWLVSNPFSTVPTGAGDPLIGTDVWVKRALHDIQEDGAEQFLVNRLAAFRNTCRMFPAALSGFPDFGDDSEDLRAGWEDAADASTPH